VSRNNDPVTRLAQNTTYLSVQEAELRARAQRQADALAYLTRNGHDDLLDMLGLVESTKAGRRRHRAAS
jgi:hypothetical protein